MCITTQDCKPVANYLHKTGKDVYDVFSDLVQKISPDSAMPGHCLMTGEPMSHEHMYPQGLTPRHMTDQAYNAIIHRNNNWQCPMCSQVLDDNKRHMQKIEPREMKHHHCDRCWDYHLLLAGVVHSVPEAMRVVKTRQNQQMPVRQAPKQVYSNNAALPYVPADYQEWQEPLGITYEPQTSVSEMIEKSKKPSKVKQLIRRLKS